MVASILRIIYGIPTKYFFAISYLVIILLSFFVPSEYLAISFDSGGVTTGPMTVPVIMALGIGTASVLQQKSELDEPGTGIGFVIFLDKVFGICHPFYGKECSKKES